MYSSSVHYDQQQIFVNMFFSRFVPRHHRRLPRPVRGVVGPANSPSPLGCRSSLPRCLPKALRA